MNQFLNKIVNYCKFKTLLKYCQINKNKKEEYLKNEMKYSYQNRKKLVMYYLLKKDMINLMCKFGSSMNDKLMMWCIKYYKCGIIILSVYYMFLIYNCENKFIQCVIKNKRQDIIDYLNNVKGYKFLNILTEEYYDKKMIIKKIIIYKLQNNDNINYSYFNNLYNIGFFLDFADIIDWHTFHNLFIRDNLSRQTLFTVLELKKKHFNPEKLNKNEYSALFLKCFNEVKLNKFFIQKIKESNKINPEIKIN